MSGGKKKDENLRKESPAEHVGLVAADCRAAASSADSPSFFLFSVSGVRTELKEREQTKISSVMHSACAAVL